MSNVGHSVTGDFAKESLMSTWPRNRSTGSILGGSGMRPEEEPEDSAVPPVVQLVKDGVWQVPKNQRPKGWEKFGVKEPGFDQRR